jgi:hypothetical protein
MNSAGKAGRFQFGDPWLALQAAYDKRVQLISYWGIELRGGREAAAAASFTAGGAGDPGVSIVNDRSQIGLVVKGHAAQAVDLQQWITSANVIMTAVDKDGKLLFGPSGSQDTNLYRSAANELATDDIVRFNVAGTFQTTVGAAGGGSALPATPTKYLKIKDDSGTLFVVPCYAAS